MKTLFCKVSIPFFILVIFFSACRKESFINSSDARLDISRDTIKFDTVFTAAGSVTQSFKILNNNNQKILLDKVQLAGGNSSAFKININGNETTEETNIEIAANDSIYVFVSVFIDPTVSNQPFLLTDSILVSYNGNERFLQLQAYGQNAHYLSNAIISSNTTWVNDLPYVILGSIQVDTGTILSIPAGTKIYLHANAPFLVDGSLNVSGEKNNEVQFAGDRLDQDYRDLPAAWPGIYFRSASINNQLNFAIIKNASQAIVADGPASNSNPKLILQQCIIDNAFISGIYAINSSIDVNNSLISNCGNNIFIQLGGRYTFTNCTVAAYSNNYIIHTNPVLQVSNAAVRNGATATSALSANFINCIFWGNDGAVDDEIVTHREGGDPFDVGFQNCLYKALNDPPDVSFQSSISNLDPSFDSIDVSNNYYDFHTNNNPFAPGINNGTVVAFPFDLDANARTVGMVDIGSYELQ